MKVIYSDNTNLIDISKNVSNYHSGNDPFTFVASEDSFYIGSRFAFNQFWIKMAPLNTASSTMSLAYWDGRAFQAAVEVQDETSGLSVDGRVTFVPDKNYGWLASDTVKSSGDEEVTGLGDLTIYNMYWLKVTFDNDLDADVAFSWIGSLFATDEDLYSEYPMFNNSNLMTAIEAGKTDYEEQRLRATEVTIDNLIAKNIIDSGNQLLDASKLKTIVVTKTAEIIFNMLGFEEYEDDRKKAREEYNARINKDIFNVDLNANATLDDKELNVRQGRMWR